MKGQTIFFDRGVYVEETATIAGPKEGYGPLGKYYDSVLKDDAIGQKSYEASEFKMHESLIRLLLNKSKRKHSDVDICFAGDLLDELVGTNFAMRNTDICYMGVYNACATFGEALAIAASMINGGAIGRAICSTTSHFSTAERQYRFPLELGNQRTPLAQWTTTGAGATMLSGVPSRVRVESATIGKVCDFGVTDVNNMGAAMAPDAIETLKAHLRDTGRKPTYYDLIMTGDLGDAGSRLLRTIAKKDGIILGDNLTDGGVLIYNRAMQDVGQGGSGASCSSLVFNGYIYRQMLDYKLKKVLIIPTGALLSKTSSLQGETIPTIAHGVSFELMEN